MLRQIAPKYMDVGKAKVVYRHMAQIGQESEWAAEAVECANDQNQFWPFTIYLFDHQTGENVGNFSKDNLKKYAADFGKIPDLNTFGQCLDSDKYLSYVRQETAEGRTKGVRATPSFFVNGQFIEGVPSAQQFSNTIDAMLPKK